MTQLQQQIKAAFPRLTLRLDEPLARHTAFRIGGPAEVMAFPSTVEELSGLLAWASGRGIVPAVLGSGTNVLAAERGRRGLVICTKGALTGVERTGPDTIRAMAGTTMAATASFAASLGLSGLEFAHGIPGSVGGGLYMNAGASEDGKVCSPPEGSVVWVPGRQAHRPITTASSSKHTFHNFMGIPPCGVLC